jgi:excisionase family DNA binding protein
MTTTGEKLLCSPDEAAELLGCGRSFMFELLARGEIESIKVGRLRKIPRDALATYVQRLRAESAVSA